MILDPIERYLKNEGIKEGIEQAKHEVARNMLDEGFSVDVILRVTDLSIEDILKAN